jgi:uncharacterized membrane protein
MNTEFLKKNRLLTLMTVLTGIFGIVMLIVAVRLWRQFDMAWSSFVALSYGCFLLLMALHIWRNSSHFTEKARRMGFSLTSSALIFAALISILTAPSIANLPLYHPKTLSCLVMVVAGGLFAVKACRKKTAA